MKKIVDAMQRIQIAIGGLFLLIFLSVVVYQIACRYLGVVAMWTEDVSMYSFIWAVFMGAGAMVHSDAHFAFTSVLDAIRSEKKKALLRIFIKVVVLVFCVLMVVYGYRAAKQFWNFRWINIPSMKRGPTWLCLPICGATASVYLVYGIIEQVKILMGGAD